MTLDEAIKFIDRLSYGPKARIRAMRSYHDFNVLEIVISKEFIDVVNGESTFQMSMSATTKDTIQNSLNPIKLILEIVKATIVQLETHEIDEWFKLDGKCINNPHPELGVQFRAEV